MHGARIALGSTCFVALLAACVGGPGPLPDQGLDQTSQGGGISSDPTGNTSDTATSGSTNSGSTGSKNKPAVSLRASDYEQACEVDSDCVPVFEGDACSPCKCASAAIATSALTQYTADLQKGAKDCPDPGDVSCAPCQTATAGCDPDTKMCALGVSSNGGG